MGLLLLMRPASNRLTPGLLLRRFFVPNKILLWSEICAVGWTSSRTSFYCFGFVSEKCICHERKGRAWGEERDVYLEQNQILKWIVVLLRSTNQRIKLDPTRGQESAHWPPACIHNSIRFLAGGAGFELRLWRLPGQVELLPIPH